LFKDTLETVALFGGSFDPPHFGHQSVVKVALELLNIDKLIVVPAYLNPFKTSSLATPTQRLRWTKEVFKAFPKVMVDDYEIGQGKATPTAQTLAHFQKEYEVKYLIIGADNLASIEKWHQFEWLNKQVTWVVATRAGYKADTSVLAQVILLEVNQDVSSTQIRTAEEIENIDDLIKDEVLELLRTKG